MVNVSIENPKALYIDLGFGNVAIGIKTSQQSGDVPEINFMNMTKCKELGMPVTRKEVDRTDNKIVITFPDDRPDELDLLIIRLLELRMAQYGPEPSKY